MKTIDYIKHKNRIIHRATGLILVPEDQIIDIPTEKVGELSMTGDAWACPYCRIFWIAGENCTSCPMSLAGNKCGISTGNTYDRVIEEVSDGYGVVNKRSRVYDEMCELIEWYNAELDIHDQSN